MGGGLDRLATRGTTTSFVLLDRDGTIIHDRHHLTDPEGVELLPGAVEGLRQLRALGLGLVVVTNQSVVGRGLIDDEGLERIHARMRALWGFPDSSDLTKKDIFQAHYRGKRYSFGYPACPDLESQALLFSLLRPEEIGVELTEGFMMEPEASVSALVFSHPDAAYFSVGIGDE